MKKVIFVSHSRDLADDFLEFVNDLNIRTNFYLIGEGIGTILLKDKDELLSLLRQKEPDVLIIQFPLFKMGVRKTGSSGHSIHEFIRQIIQDIVLNKALLFILSDTDEYREEAMAFGADDYITLPYEAMNLLGRINARFVRLEQITANTSSQEVSQKYIRHHVFISYSRKDTFFMKKVIQDLEAGGVTFWTDESLEVGTVAWTQHIQEAIEYSGGLIVLMSPDAKASVWVIREISYALEHNVRIFPVLIEGTIKNSTPIQLIDAQISNLTKDYTPNMATLIKTIRKHVGIIDFSE